MTRRRHLQKHLRQGNACRDTAQNILPASNNLQDRDCQDHTGCACIQQPSTDFSGDSLNAQRPLSPSTSHGKEFRRACTQCLKSHLGFCPETSYPLVSFMCLHWKRCSPSPWHSRAAFISPLSPLLQLEELYFLFLLGKQFHSFDHSCHPALNLFQSYSNSFERELNFPLLYCRELL